MNEEMKEPELIRTRQTFRRCNFCGKDEETVYPKTISVNQKTVEYMLHIAQSKKEPLTILSKSIAIPGMVNAIDEITLRPINGYIYKVNALACRGCFDRIGWRHKFRKDELRMKGARKVI